MVSSVILTFWLKSFYVAMHLLKRDISLYVCEYVCGNLYGNH